MNEILGSGAFCQVEARDDIAIKRFTKNKCSNFIQEISILKYISKSPNNQYFIDILGVYIDDKVSIHMPKYSFDLSKDWRTLLSTDTFNKFISLVSSFTHDILAGISFLHSAGIIHRDIKPGNILYNEVTKKCVICDFNIAIMPADLHTPLSSCVQTMMYRAPEINFHSKTSTYTFNIDVWSTGCVLFELLTKKYFFATYSDSFDLDNPMQQALNIYGKEFAYLSNAEIRTILIRRIQSIPGNSSIHNILNKLLTIDAHHIPTKSLQLFKHSIDTLINILSRSLCPSNKRSPSDKLYMYLCDELNYTVIVETPPARISNIPNIDTVSAKSLEKISLQIEIPTNPTNVQLYEIKLKNKRNSQFTKLLASLPPKIRAWLFELLVRYYKTCGTQRRIQSDEDNLIVCSVLQIISLITESTYDYVDSFRKIHDINDDAIYQKIIDIMKTLNYEIII